MRTAVVLLGVAALAACSSGSTEGLRLGLAVDLPGYEPMDAAEPPAQLCERRTGTADEELPALDPPDDAESLGYRAERSELQVHAWRPGSAGAAATSVAGAVEAVDACDYD